MSFYIESYNFTKPVSNSSAKLLSDDIMGTNWPVVYILHGNKEIYVGETSDADGRMNQHLDPNGPNYEKRSKLDKVEIIFDTTYNKSAILDIEQSLIRLFKFEINARESSKKSKYFKTIQNQNNGQSRQHNYYQRSHYLQEVEYIWEELRNRNIATIPYNDIVNDAIFKFSPYTTLTQEQSNTCISILEGAMDALEALKEGRETEYTAIVQGDAGTGKTIILMHMMAFVSQAMYTNLNAQAGESDDELDDEDQAISVKTLNRTNALIKRIREYVNKYGILKIAYVAQMSSLRNTVGTVLSGIDHLHKNHSKGPNDIANDYINTGQKFDIIFVDEGHRLWQRNGIPSMGAFDNVCRNLYGADVNPSTKTTLDWLFDCSKSRVIIYDNKQTVKKSDISEAQYKATIESHDSTTTRGFILKHQMRCQGGTSYLSYINSIFNVEAGLIHHDISDYDLQLFSNPNDLIESILKANNAMGLCKVVAGCGWQWNRGRYDEANRAFNEAVANGSYNNTRASKVNYYLNHLNVEDGLIKFEHNKYVRNLDFNWIIDGDPREIGCIHTAQGYDLNYVGVLFGPEIDYVEGSGIVIYEEKIKDSAVGAYINRLQGENLENRRRTIRNYVLNSYKVMMERGIKGCYVWAYNSGLQDYLRKFIRVNP